MCEIFSNTLVQEYNTFNYASKYQEQLFMNTEDL